MATATTITDLLTEWYEFKEPEFSPSTKATTRYAIATLVDAFGDTALDGLTTRSIDLWGSRMRAQGLQAAVHQTSV